MQGKTWHQKESNLLHGKSGNNFQLVWELGSLTDSSVVPIYNPSRRCVKEEEQSLDPGGTTCKVQRFGQVVTE